MDYGRLFLFMAATTGVMALTTHVWCWIHDAVVRAAIRRALSREHLFEEALELRRQGATSYLTYEQYREDLRSGVPLDDILDRLKGVFPPRAADIQHPPPPPPPSAPLSLSTLLLVFGAASALSVLCGLRLTLPPEFEQWLTAQLSSRTPNKAS